MKNGILTLASLMLLTLVTISTSHAQENRGGIKGGVNFSSLYINDVEDENVRVGFHIGIFTQLGDGSFVIQPELNYSAKGARTEYGGTTYNGTADFNLNYLDIPVLATFKIGDAADIHFGPYFGYLVGARSKTEDNFFTTNRELDRDNFEKWDFGLAGGAALNFDAMSIGVRYNYGLREIAKSSDAKSLLGDAKNSNAQIYLALNLR